MPNLFSSLRTFVVVGVFIFSVTIVVSASVSIDPRCGVSCGENGSCQPSNITSTCTTTSCMYECACNHGWLGNGCMLKYEVCEDTITGVSGDARTCYNGGRCEVYDLDSPESNGKTTGIRCNCQTYANETKAYAGFQCEYAEEEVCVRDRNHSSYAFCTNNGTCKDLIDFGERHPLCNCPKGFVGRHCQFNVEYIPADATPPEEVELLNTLFYGNGTINEDHASQSLSNGTDELSGGMTVFVVFASIGAFALLCFCCYFFVIKKRRSRKEAEVVQEKNKANDSEIL
jgi:hypothetical protein